MRPEAVHGSAISSWVLAARPKTLTASLVPIVAATALALNHAQSFSGFPWHLGALALLCALLIQIGTNFINDALDYLKGADNESRLGPKRAAAGGLIDVGSVWKAGVSCFGLAVLLSLPLVASGGVPILIIGIFSIISGYLYTGGPKPLAYIGFGEIFVLIFFGWVAVSGMHYLYSGYFTDTSLVAGTQIGLLAVALIAINNLRDYQNDRTVGKLTLAARFGLRWGRLEIAFSIIIPFALSLFWFYRGFNYAAVLPFFSLPLGLKIIRSIFLEEPSEEFNKYLAQSALLHLLFGVLLSIGLLFDAA